MEVITQTRLDYIASYSKNYKAKRISEEIEGMCNQIIQSIEAGLDYRHIEQLYQRLQSTLVDIFVIS